MFKIVWRTILVLFVASIVYVFYCKYFFPPITITQIGAVTEGYGLKRDYVKWDEISTNVKLAAIASEDQLFATHGGFDWTSIEKSLDPTSKTKRKHALGAAASTISQQTAKNVFLWQGSGKSRYIRKIPEFAYTKLIEWSWGKKRIMEVYLNVAEMGPGIFGIEAAAQQYFHKHANELSKAEAAQIIACLPNPKEFTVVPQSNRVHSRYPKIMKQMSILSHYDEVEDLIGSK